MTEWWFGYDAAQTTVECSGATHRLLWEKGTLHGLDHNDDPEGERTLAALAGERNACVDILDMWRRHQDDLRVLVSGSRGPADALAPQEPHPAQAAAAASGSGRPQRVQPPSPEQELITLLTLGGRLPDPRANTSCFRSAGSCACGAAA